MSQKSSSTSDHKASIQQARLLGAEQTMCLVRTVAIGFALIQIFTFYLPYPPGIEQSALAVVGVLTVGNVVFFALLRRPISGEGLRALSVASLTFDLIVVFGIIFVYTFDVDTAVWAVVYLLPLGGAFRFQLRGALAVTLAATVLYAAREVYGYYEYGHEIFVTSITFRMGIALIIAFFAGTTASRLLDERNVVEDANRELSAVNMSMREFVAIASHDMRTPLTVIGGLSTHMMQNWDDLTETQRLEFTKAIDRQTQVLVNLVNDLLTASNIDAGTTAVQPTNVNVRNLASRAWRDVQETEPTIDCDADLTVFADEGHIERIMVNLLTNAVKYGAEPIKIDAHRDHEWVEIRVEDSGEGVAEDFAPRLFDRFTRSSADPNAEGSGLGLSIVKGLAEMNGGSVHYEAKEPKGSVFSVRLHAGAR